MERATLTPIQEALEAEYGTDAHGASYHVLEEDGCFRLAKDCIRNTDVHAAVKVQVAMIDLDRNPHTLWDSAENAIQTVATLAALFPDAVIFTTRRGVRMVYAYDQPLAPMAYESACKRLVAAIDKVLRSADIKLDVDQTTTQWTRIFRMPKVIRDGRATWKDSQFILHIPVDWSTVPSHRENIASAKGEPAEEFEYRDPPSVPQVQPVSEEEWKNVINTLAEPLARAGLNGLLGKLREGQPFFSAGERNATTYRVLSQFLEVFYSIAGHEPVPEEVYRLFRDATAATRGQTHAHEALSELWGMISRMVDARRYVEQSIEVPLPRRTTLTPWGTLPILAYTGGRSRYIWNPARNNYTDPISSVAALKAMFSDIWGSTYQPPVSISEELLLHMYGTHIDEVVLDLASERPHIEDNTERGRALVLPVGRRLLVNPEYDPDVAQWLKLLGGDDSEGLLDWLHWSLQLNEPLCALYLYGPKGAGKGMIAQALSAFWSGIFVKFDEAVGHFNGRLRQSPIIWLDENSNATNTGAFRSLIGNSAHTVERKFMDTETLRGNVRLIITANNEDALSLGDVQTIFDVEAVTQRVRFVRLGEEASTFLRERGGRQWTNDWVVDSRGQPGRVGRHLMWLVQNHVPTALGSRFRVEGKPTSWHYKALYSGDVGAVLAYLAEELAKGGPAASVRHVDGRVVVNIVRFLSNGYVTGALRSEGVDQKAMRRTLDSICRDSDTIREGDSVWSVVPLSIISDMPQTVYRKEKAYWRVQDILRQETEETQVA
jgi:hypothetical protein